MSDENDDFLDSTADQPTWDQPTDTLSASGLNDFDLNSYDADTSTFSSSIDMPEDAGADASGAGTSGDSSQAAPDQKPALADMDWNTLMNSNPEPGSDDSNDVEVDPTRARRVTVWAVVIAGIVLFLLGGVLYLHFHYQNVVAPGVSLGSVDMGGKTREEARQEIQTLAGQTTVTVVANNGSTVVGTLDDLGVIVNADQTVDNLINAKPSSSFTGFFTRISPFSKQSVSIAADIDKTTMTKYLTDNLVDEDSRLENATIGYNKDTSTFTYTDSKDGKAPDINPVVTAAQAALASPGTNQETNTTITDGNASITTDNAKNACDEANKRLASPILLRTDAGTSFTIPVNTVASWITLTSNIDTGEITMDYDEDAIASFAKDSIAGNLNQDEVDQVSVKTDTNVDLGVTQSGVDGVDVGDTSSLSTDILNALKSGNGGKITVDATVTAFSAKTETRKLTTANGDQWINIDLTNQKMTVSNGSTMVKEFDISTGTAISPTPAGGYLTWGREETMKLSTETKGTPSWVTEYGDDLLIMGADWASQDIADGLPSSAGGVYMNVDDAKWVYDNVSDKVVVIVSGSTPTTPVRAEQTPDATEGTDGQSDQSDQNGQSTTGGNQQTATDNGNTTVDGSGDGTSSSSSSPSASSSN